MKALGSVCIVYAPPPLTHTHTHTHTHCFPYAVYRGRRRATMQKRCVKRRQAGTPQEGPWGWGAQGVGARGPVV